MKTLRTILTAAGILAVCLTSTAQELVAYSLPLTVVNVDVSCEHELFEAGKYAPWAKELLGEDVPQKSSVTTRITSLRIYPTTENDRSAVNLAEVSGESKVAFNTLMDNGFITSISSYSAQASYEVSGSLDLHEPKGGKSLQAEAKKAAEQIKAYREQKYRIVTGDTDATYSGEALGAAIAELNRLEGELLAQFRGNARKVRQSISFQIVPEDEGIYSVLEAVPGKGLVASTGKSQVDYKIRISAQKPDLPVSNQEEQTPAKKGKKPQKIVYRIPAICTVTMIEDGNEILRTRMPISQLGVTAEYAYYNN